MINKLVIIIGAGNGFGLSLAGGFSNEGYDVVLVGRNVEKLNGQVQKANLQKRKIHTFYADVTCQKSMSTAFGKIRALNQPIALLIYNAVARRACKPSELTAEAVLEDLKVTMGGAITATNLILPIFKEEQEGAIIFTGGGVALSPSVTSSSMSIGKAGLRNYVLNLANELAGSNTYIGMVTITKPVQPETTFSPEFIAGEYIRLFSLRHRVELVL